LVLTVNGSVTSLTSSDAGGGTFAGPAGMSRLLTFKILQRIRYVNSEGTRMKPISRCLETDKKIETKFK